mgnify:CR=1 FL=1
MYFGLFQDKLLIKTKAVLPFKFVILYCNARNVSYVGPCSLSVFYIIVVTPGQRPRVRSDNLATTLRLRPSSSRDWRERDWGQQPPAEIVDSARLRPRPSSFPCRGMAAGPALTSYVMIM